MLPSAVTDLKTFVPAKDAALSKKFYGDSRLAETGYVNRERVSHIFCG